MISHFAPSDALIMLLLLLTRRPYLELRAAPHPMTNADLTMLMADEVRAEKNPNFCRLIDSGCIYPLWKLSKPARSRTIGPSSR